MKATTGPAIYYGIIAMVSSLILSAKAYEHGDSVPEDFEMPRPLPLEDSVHSLVTHPDLKIELVAAEPLTRDPVYLDWDTKGRLWVVEMADYPLGIDGKGKPGGRIRFLTDTDGDGTFETSTLFLDGLNCPTGVMEYRDGVLVAAAPDIFYAEDTDGDGKADHREILYSGFKEGNQQHRVNGFAWGLDGWLHIANGDSGGTITSLKTGKSAELGSQDITIHPDTGDMKLVAGRTQYGRNRDDWGTWFGCNNTNPAWQYMPVERYREHNPHVVYPGGKHLIPEIPSAPPVFPLSTTDLRFNDPHARSRITSACSTMIHRGVLLGERFQGNFFTCEPVHNLVHRESIERTSYSFRSVRANDEEAAEFLASSDSWFRPVCVKTGPDGSIYVADMHRYVIEHPEWIPEEWQKVLDVRAGEDKGRIYRISSKNSVPDKNAAKLKHLDNTELLQRLSDPNGWVRDHSHRLLLERNQWTKKDLISLKKLASSVESGAGSVHALNLLAGINELAAEDIETILTGPQNTEVKTCALRIAAELEDTSSLTLPSSTSPIFDHELALFLASQESRDDGVKALTKIVSSDAGQDAYLQAAVLSAIPRYIDETKRSLGNWPLEERPVLLRGLVETSVALKETDLLTAIIESHSSPFDVVALLIEVTDRRKINFGNWVNEHRDHLPKILHEPDALIKEARKIAENGDRPVADRLSAIGLLGRFQEWMDEDGRFLTDLMSVRETGEIRTAAALRLIELGKGASIFQKWDSFPMSVRSEILEGYLQTQALTLDLLKHIKDETLPAGAVPATTQQNLVMHLSSKIRIPAKEIFGSDSSGRAEVVQQYLAELKTERSPQRGKDLFAAHCAACHKMGDLGNGIGANLDALKDKSDSALVTAILDPNAAVEDKFTLCMAELKDGTFLTGMLAEESAQFLTLTMLSGERRQIARDEIKTFQYSSRSLMPEGLEAALDPVAIGDLISFLQSSP